MPRPAKGPRLYLYERTGREATWIIRDGASRISTGASLADRRRAEKALADYIGKKHTRNFGDGDPAQVLVADVISLYLEEWAKGTPSAATAAYHAQALLSFWGDKCCAEVSGKNCRAYVTHRGETGRRVSQATARRELETLSAAMAYAYRERKLDRPIPVTYPPKSPPRDRWLTRSEAAALIAGALGWAVTACDVRTHKPIAYARLFRPSYHVARFILICLYTGTRHAAALKLRWGVNSAAGWIDIDGGMIYRRGRDEIETRKRRPPVRLSARLSAHCHRWRSCTTVGPIEYAGRQIAKERKGFEAARDRMGLGDDVVPHVLKHTFATWAVLARLPFEEIAVALGTSVAMVERVYGHHAPDYTREVVEAVAVSAAISAARPKRILANAV
jgi:integrase